MPLRIIAGSGVAHMAKDNNKIEWVRCPACTHKLFKVSDGKQFNIQIKCNSCKSLIRVTSSPTLADGSYVEVDIEFEDRKFPPRLERKNR